MRKTFKRLDLFVGLVLALGHIWFYYYDISHYSEGGWGGFLTFVIDLPLSILLIKLIGVLSLSSPIILLVGGTLWWFCLGTLISMLIRRFSRLIRHLSGPITRLADWLVKVIEGDERGA